MYVCACVHVHVYSNRLIAGGAGEPAKGLKQSMDKRSCRSMSLTKTGPQEGEVMREGGRAAPALIGS